MDYAEATEWLRVLINDNNNKLFESININNNNISTFNNVHDELHDNVTFINMCKYIKYKNIPHYWTYLFLGYIIKYKTELDNLKKPLTFVPKEELARRTWTTPDEIVDGILKEKQDLEATNNTLVAKLKHANNTITLLKSKLEEKDCISSSVTEMEDNIPDSAVSVDDLKAALSPVSKRDVYIPCKSCKNLRVITGSKCTTCDPVCTKTTTIKSLYEYVPDTVNEEILNVLKQSNIDYDQYMLQLKNMRNKCNKYSIESKAKVEYMTKQYNKLLKENTLLRQKDELLTNELMEVREELNMHINNDYLSSLNNNIDTVNTNVCLLKSYIIKLLTINDYESTISRVPSVISSKTSSTSSYTPKRIPTTPYSDTPDLDEEDSEGVSEEDSEEISEEEEVIPVKKVKNKHKN